MAYNNNNINQASGAGVPAGGESMPPGATRDFQPMGTQSLSFDPLAPSVNPFRSPKSIQSFFFLLLTARS